MAGSLRRGWIIALALGVIAAAALGGVGAEAADVAAQGAADPPNGQHAWWFWPSLMFSVTFVLGVIAVLSGVGG
ncbi:MAG: sulfite exporter TauE/SafE family protein, partial [Magnetococcales bacterium]|nr:sulfite exporter TauE/SafE family protein [Magnetococcales bacterium]